MPEIKEIKSEKKDREKKEETSKKTTLNKKEPKYIYIGEEKLINGIMFRKYIIIDKKYRDKAIEGKKESEKLFLTMEEFAEYKKTLIRKKGVR